MNVEIKRDGLKLQGRILRTNEEKGAALIIFHGFGGDSGYEENDLYTLLTNHAVDCGVSVARFDFSGCGRSEGKFEDMDLFREMIDAIDKVFASFADPLHAGYEHEQYVTGLIHTIYDAASTVKDFRTMQFLDWFVKEQGEEETNAEGLIKKFDLFGSDPRALYMLDNELASRVYSAPSLVL